MELQQTFVVPFVPDAVWRCFRDTEAIVACLPGAALSGPAVDGKLPLTMTVKLGPIVAAFAGEGQMQLDDGTRSGAVTGSGADRKSGSRVKGEAAFALHEAATPDGGPATRVEIRVDYAIAGSLAQFSRGGIVRELAARLTDAFADNLKRKLEATAMAPAQSPPEALPAAFTAPPTPVAAPAPAATDVPVEANLAPSATRAAPANAPLDLGAMFWPALWSRLRALLRLAPRR
jgi:carbon monoxide dehydrogenase subunit G